MLLFASALGFDALSLANNHTGDFGPVAFDETLHAFQGRRIQAFGAGRDLERAGRAAVVRRNGVVRIICSNQKHKQRQG